MSGDIVASNGKVPFGSTECTDSLAKQVGRSSLSLCYASIVFFALKGMKSEFLNQCYICPICKSACKFCQCRTSSFRDKYCIP